MEYVTFIPGKPEPQGSKKGFIINNKVVLVESATGLKAWRQKVYNAFVDNPHGVITNQPIQVSMIFTLEQAKSNKKPKPTQKPDIDKLARAVLDGMTGSAFGDDSQVTHLVARKQWGKWPGVVVTVAIDNEPN